MVVDIVVFVGDDFDVKMVVIEWFVVDIDLCVVVVFNVLLSGDVFVIGDGCLLIQFGDIVYDVFMQVVMLVGDVQLVMLNNLLCMKIVGVLLGFVFVLLDVVVCCDVIDVLLKLFDLVFKLMIDCVCVKEIDLVLKCCFDVLWVIVVLYDFDLVKCFEVVQVVVVCSDFDMIE